MDHCYKKLFYASFRFYVLEKYFSFVYGSYFKENCEIGQYQFSFLSFIRDWLNSYEDLAKIDNLNVLLNANYFSNNQYVLKFFLFQFKTICSAQY